MVVNKFRGNDSIENRRSSIVGLGIPLEPPPKKIVRPEVLAATNERRDLPEYEESFSIKNY